MDEGALRALGVEARQPLVFGDRLVGRAKRGIGPGQNVIGKRQAVNAQDILDIGGGTPSPAEFWKSDTAFSAWPSRSRISP